MNTQKNTWVALAALSALSAYAVVPEVSNVAMAQDAARLVTITYTLADAPAVVTVDVQTNATVDGQTVWASIGGANIQQMAGDVWKKVEPGEHTVLWRPDLSWPDHRIPDGGARAVVTAWSLDNPPDYMVVNLASNAAANSETYYPAVEFLPGGLFGNPDYRTSKLVMRKILAKGVEWTMGSDLTEPGRDGSREAMHTVTIGDNYYIAVFETTQAQWGLVQTARAAPSYYNVERAMRPVEQVCYNEIRNAANSTTADTAYDYPADPNPKSFLGLLRAKTGLAFDLPSEAQWEFACRAGTTSAYNNGNDKLPVAVLGSFKDFNGYTADADSGASLLRVGSRLPNAWGLYDMHGNVYEWCLDSYAAEGYGTVSLSAVLVDPCNTVDVDGTSRHRVRRGGSYRASAADGRSASRFYWNAPFQGTGFRVLCRGAVRP